MKRSHLLLITALLFIIAASRITYLNTRELDIDEVWTVWQTFGTPQQIIAWTPYDWTPLSYLMIGGWQSVTGIHPFSVSMMSVLVFLVASALMYRAACQLIRDRLAALFVTAAYAAFNFTLHYSTGVRGYILIIGLVPLALCLALAYMRHPRLWTGGALALSFAAMYYVHPSGLFSIVSMGLVIAVLESQHIVALIRRWIAPAILTALLIFPGFMERWGLISAEGRLAAVASVDVPPVFTAVVNILVDYTGHAIWLPVIGIAAGILMLRHKLDRRVIALLLLALFPFAMYALQRWTGTIAVRHFVALAFGYAALIGWGTAEFAEFLKRRLAFRGVFSLMFNAALGAALCVPMFARITPSYYVQGPPMQAAFQMLSQQMRWGDALVIDPNLLASPEEWDYYIRAYFPNGLIITNDPTPYRRVWYATREGSRDPELESAVLTGRIARQFVGPWDFLIRLYEAPPDREGVLFANGMRLHGLDVLEDGDIFGSRLVRREGESISVRLWWTVDTPVALDYSVSLQVVDQNGVMVAQVDSAPQVKDAPSETSRWTPGILYTEKRTLTLPYPTQHGTYRIALAVYHFSDGVRLDAPSIGTDGLLTLDTLYVKAW
jgi:uncharacterized protein YfiM (DUF2279 family)